MAGTDRQKDDTQVIFCLQEEAKRRKISLNLGLQAFFRQKNDFLQRSIAGGKNEELTAILNGRFLKEGDTIEGFAVDAKDVRARRIVFHDRRGSVEFIEVEYISER